MLARIARRRLGMAPGLATDDHAHSSRINRSDSTKLMRVGATLASWATACISSRMRL